MRIKKIKWRNFNAYGNQWHEIVFDQNFSLNLIAGINGSGKSTIMEVIIFGLYGKVKDKNLTTIVNRINKNLEVEIEFVSRNKHFLVQRGMEPTYTKITMDGQNLISDVAGKKNSQNILNDYLQIPLNIFINLIALDINRFVSFIRMSPSEKKSIIDKIFGLDEVNLMHESIKLDIKNQKKKVEKIKDQIDWIRRDVEKFTNQIEVLRKEDEEEEESEDYEILNKRLEEAKSKQEKIKEKELELDSKKSKINTIIKDLFKKETEENSNLRQLQKKLNLLINEQKCPTCGIEFHDSEYHQVLKKELEVDIAKIEENLGIVKEKIKDINTKEQNISDKIYQLKKIKDSILEEMSDINDQFKIVKNKNQSKIDNLQKIISDKLNEIKEEDKKYLSENNELSFFVSVEEILNESGFKRTIFNNLIPNFNKQISKISKIMQVPFDLIFDDTFDTKLLYLGKEIDIKTLSTGENKKLDLVVLISLIALLKMKFKDLNIMFLDEIFAGLDLLTQNHLVGVFSDISKKLNLHLFIINHAPFQNTDFDNVYEIDKVSEFSRFRRLEQE